MNIGTPERSRSLFWQYNCAKWETRIPTGFSLTPQDVVPTLLHDPIPTNRSNQWRKLSRAPSGEMQENWRIKSK